MAQVYPQIQNIVVEGSDGRVAQLQLGQIMTCFSTYFA